MFIKWINFFLCSKKRERENTRHCMTLLCNTSWKDEGNLWSKPKPTTEQRALGWEAGQGRPPHLRGRQSGTRDPQPTSEWAERRHTGCVQSPFPLTSLRQLQEFSSPFDPLGRQVSKVWSPWKLMVRSQWCASLTPVFLSALPHTSPQVSRVTMGWLWQASGGISQRNHTWKHITLVWEDYVGLAELRSPQDRADSCPLPFAYSADQCMST